MHIFDILTREKWQTELSHFALVSFIHKQGSSLKRLDAYQSVGSESGLSRYPHFNVECVTHQRSPL